MESLTRKLQATKRATPREAIWAANGKVIRVGILKPFGVHIPPLCDPQRLLDMELQESTFSLLGSVLLWSHSFFPCCHSSLLEWECLLCVIVSYKYVICVCFNVGSQLIV
jgi:hypothetical protein